MLLEEADHERVGVMDIIVFRRDHLRRHAGQERQGAGAASHLSLEGPAEQIRVEAGSCVA
jgi:hypothetical protein